MWSSRPTRPNGILRPLLILALGPILLAACAGSEDAPISEPDPFAAPDVGDHALEDARVDSDAAPRGDAALPADALAPVDSGGTTDAVVERDAADPADATPLPDAETAPDAAPPPEPPDALFPCEVGRCWSTLSFGGTCGRSTLDEDFSSGRYNVHAFELFVPGGVAVELTLRPTSGAWRPALVLHDEEGQTIFDGERGVVTRPLSVQAIATGRDGGAAGMWIEARRDRQLTVFLTSWHVVDGGFEPEMPRDVTYTFTVVTDCEPPADEELLSPPNLDEDDVVGGYLLLPPSQPAGLYTRKADGCSRGTRLLIDVLYTVAVRWNALRPEHSPIDFRDLNEGPCSDVNHDTHDDGTHADVMADCATNVDCADVQPAIDLATLFINTGQVCGIIFNDEAVQARVNPDFEARYDFEPWHGTFMRSVGSHVRHFHVRVKKPDGTCN